VSMLTFRWPWETPQGGLVDDEEIPSAQQPSGRPVTAPRVWTPMGPLDERFDPCGVPAPPVRPVTP
jgi:hypothetical protein